WKESVMLSDAPGSAQLLQLQELYVQRTELSERRQVLRMLDEVTSHDLRRGLDAMLDLLTLNDELDTSTAVEILPDVLATARRLATSMTQAHRERFLHRLCVISACYPDHASDVEAVGVAIVQAAEAVAVSWMDILQLSVFGVGADEAVCAAQRLMRDVSLSEVQDEAGDVAEAPSGDSDLSIRVQIEARRALQLRANATNAPIPCDNLKWTLPEDLTIDPTLTKVHPHYRRSGGAAVALRRRWAEQNVSTTSVVDDVINILGGGGSGDEEHATAGSPLDLLSWTCAHATWGEVNASIYSLNVRHDHKEVFQSDADDSDDSSEDEHDDVSADGWKEWADNKYLCPSIGSQVIFSSLCDMPKEKRSVAFQQICEHVNEAGHDPVKLSSSLQMRKQRICLEVIVEALRLPVGSDLQLLAAQHVAARTESVDENQKHIAPLTHFVSKALQRSFQPETIVSLLPVLQSVASKHWKCKDGRSNELLRKRKPRLLTMTPTDHLFGRSSPLWSYNEDIRRRATETALAQISSQKGSATALKIIGQCLFALLSPPNSLHRSIVMNVITELTKAINWAKTGPLAITSHANDSNDSGSDDSSSEGNDEAFSETIKIAQIISPTAAKVLIEAFATTQPRIIIDCFLREDTSTRIRASIVSTAVIVYGQRPDILDTYFEDIRLLNLAGSMLVLLSNNTDRDSKELEVILVNFFERLTVHIDAQHDDAWLTKERADILCEGECGLLKQHPILEKLRRTLLSRFLADGVITTDEQVVFSEFLGAADMTVSLTRQGCVVLDETEYRMQGNTVEFLASKNRARATYPRTTNDARTAAADVKTATTLMVEGNVLGTGGAVLSLLHDEGSATQLVVFERRTAFGDVVVHAVDRDLRASEPRALHPLASDAERERMRRELAWEPLYGGSADGKFREHTWWHFAVPAEKQLECVETLCAAVEMRSRLPAGIERSAEPPVAPQSARLDLVERVRQFVGAQVFEAASTSSACKLRANAADVLRPVDPALRTELQLHAMSRRLKTTEGAITGLRDGLTKLEVSVEDATRTIDALTAAMPDLDQLPRLLERDRDEQVRAAEVRRLESGEYTRAVYHELRSQLNGVYVAAQAVMSSIVANSQTGTAGVVGSVLSAISGSIPVVGSAVGCIGAMLSAVDAVQQEERLRRYVRVAPSGVVMDSIAEYAARRIAQMAITPAEVRATLSKPAIVSEKLGELKRAAMRFLEPPTTVAGTDEQRGRQDAAQLCALIVVKLQEGEALPSSTNEVCDVIVTFVEVHFDRGQKKESASSTALSLEPHPPSQPRQSAPAAEKPDHLVEERAGGACCQVM
ncbi:Hypothetical protein, putative, partial [Bodo saltans]